MVSLTGDEVCCWGKEFCSKPDSVQKNPCTPMRGGKASREGWRSCWPSFTLAKPSVEIDRARLEARLNLLITEALSAMETSSKDLSGIQQESRALVFLDAARSEQFTENSARLRQLSTLLRASSASLERGEMGMACEAILRAEAAVIIIKKRNRLVAPRPSAGRVHEARD